METLVGWVGTLLFFYWLYTAYVWSETPTPKPRIERKPGGEYELIKCKCGRCSSCIQDAWGVDEGTANRMAKTGRYDARKKKS
jgi:hypothetical protein